MRFPGDIMPDLLVLALDRGYPMDLIVLELFGTLEYVFLLAHNSIFSTEYFVLPHDSPRGHDCMTA